MEGWEIFTRNGGEARNGGISFIMGGWTIFKVSYPVILWTPPILPTPTPLCPHTPPPTLPCHYQLPPPLFFSVVMFLWLNGWLRHIWCAILLNGKPWYLSTRRTLMCVSCNKASSLLKSDTLWFFTGTLIWYQSHTTHTTHSGASRLTHLYKYIFAPPFTCL